MRDRPRSAARPRVALVSLGCPKNQVDSELILGRLAASGAELVEDPERADTLVVNTCAFIDRAREESVDALLDAVAWKSAAEGRRVIAAGCLVQRSGEELARALPELDGLLGLDDVARSEPPPALLAPSEARQDLRPLPVAPPQGPARALFDYTAPRRRLSPPWTAFVKIAEGCDQSCAFCAIPLFRGKMRSRTVEDLSRELAVLADEGVVEANLVAQDSTGYGRDLDLRNGLARLLRSLDRLPKAPRWIRVHYLYPGRITRSLLDAMRESERIVEYVDLPLQHADRDILRAMKRPGDADSYLRQLDALREALPGAGVRSGFIVGFPGETEDAFEILLRFVERAELDSVGVFTYSHEDETSAAALADSVPEDIKQERKQALEELAESVAWKRNRERIGARLEVLVEGQDEESGEVVGRWRGQAPDVDGRVVIRGAESVAPGSFVEVAIDDAGPHELIGMVDSGGDADR